MAKDDLVRLWHMLDSAREITPAFPWAVRSRRPTSRI
jgi:hypothetical protein